MLQQLFGTQLDFPVRVGVALFVIAVLLGVTIMLLRRFGGGMRSAAARRRAEPRLSLVDAIALDQRRKLMLVRCDEVEHLILVGGATDIVVETDITDRASKRLPAAGFLQRQDAGPREAALTREPALTREAPRFAPAPSLDALPQAEAKRPAAGELAPAAPVEAAEPAVAQPAKRPSLARRPLAGAEATPSSRAAGTTGATFSRGLSTRGAPPPAVSPAAPAAPLNLAAPEDAERTSAPAIAAPESAAPAVEATVAAPSLMPPAKDMPRDEAPRTSESLIDEMAQRLDAALDSALAGPAADAPHLSLSDLLDEDLSAPASPKDTAPAEKPAIEKPAADAPVPQGLRPEPHARPLAKVVEPERASAASEPIERVRATPAEPAAHDHGAGERITPRPRDVRPVLAPTPAFDRPDRFGAAARREPSVRPEPAAEPRAGAPDFPMRPREFAFRAPEAPPRVSREPPRVEPTRRPLASEDSRAPTPSVHEPNDTPARAPEVSVRDLLKRDTERRPVDSAPRTEPPLTARRWDAAATPGATRPSAPPPVSPTPAASEDKGAGARAADADPLGDIDPLSDLDAELANLLGRTSASGH